MEFRLPKVTLGDADVTIVGWLKAEGETVAEGEDLLEIETDKATMAVQSPETTVVSKILKGKGEVVSPGALLALLGTSPRADAAASASPPRAVADDSDGRAQVAHGAIAGLPARPHPARSAVRSESVPEPLSPARRRIARLMTEAEAIPRFAVTREVELGPAATWTAGQNGPSASDLIVRAAARAAREHPTTNAWMTPAGLTRFTEVHVAYAVDTPRGVVAPVVRSAATRDLAAIAEERRELVRCAREGALREEQLAGATITVSNGGPLGADSVTPLLTPPQVAAIGVGRVRGSGAGAVMTVTFVGDHRVLDGADGARFLVAFESAIQRPADR